jgi:serine/threonine protein kinase
VEEQKLKDIEIKLVEDSHSVDGSILIGEPNLIGATEDPERHTAMSDDVEPGQSIAASPSPGVTESFAHLGLPARFEVLEKVGTGGMATVYKARDLEGSGDHVAIKVLRTEFARDPVVVERFYREAKAAQKLEHPNLVKIQSCGESDRGVPFLVMEFVEGTDLSKVLEREKYLSVARTVNIVLQLCSVLKEAHDTGLVHRDVKPSNIILAQSADGSDIVKLVDFGIAKPKLSERLANPALTHTGSIIGSPAYMSPEQATGDSVDERSDIYSLGCVMYELLTGRSPFGADTPVKAIVQHLEQEPEPFDIEFKHLNVPVGLEEIVMKCLRKSPADRFQKVYLLSDALVTPPAPGIWRRVIAHFLDLAMVITMFSITVPPFTNSQWSYWPVATAIVVLYYCLFESSSLQATPGKLLTGLKVYDSEGKQLTALNSVLCILVCFAISFALPFFAVMVGVEYMNPSHRILLKYAFYFGFIWLTVINLWPTFFNLGRQDLVDKLFRRTTARPYYHHRDFKRTKQKPANQTVEQP